MWRPSLTGSSAAPCSAEHCWVWHVNICGSYMFSLMLHWQFRRLRICSASQRKWRRWISWKRLRTNPRRFRLTKKQRLSDWNVLLTNRSSIMNRHSNHSVKTPGRNVLMTATFVTSRTRSELRKQIALVEADQHTLPMLHHLLFTLITPHVVYMENVPQLIFCIKYWLPSVRHMAPT